MSPLGRWATLAGVLMLAAASARPAIVPAAVPMRFAPADLRADLQIIRQSLEEGSPGLYRHTSAAEFDRVCQRAMAAVNRPLTTLEFYRIAAPVVAAVKNGHTHLSLPEAEDHALDQVIPLLPLGVRVLGGKIFVVRDFSGLHPTIAGSEVLAVDGVAAPQLIARMLAVVSADGDVITSRWRIISGLGFDYRLFTVFGFRDRFTLSLRSAQGARRDSAVVGLPGKILTERWSQRYPADLDGGARRPFALRFFDGDRIALLVIPHWDEVVDAQHKTSIRTFFASVFGDLRAKNSQALIIDVRDNGGGDDMYAALLVSYLVDAPFRFFDDIWMKGLSFGFLRYASADHRQGETTTLPKDVTDMAELGGDGRYHLVKLPYWGIQQPSAPGFNGKVLLLSNGNSFSTSTEFSAFLSSHHRAEVVGEEGSGYWRANTSGVEPTLTLPTSKLRLTVPLLEFDSAVNDGTPGAHGVLPDHEVTYTVDDLLAGTDKDLAVALRLARATPPWPPA